MTGCQKLLRTEVLRPELRLPLALLVSLVFLSFAACGGSSTTPAPTAAPAPSATPTQVSPPASVSLPEDEGAHDAGIEWWYFNGHLADDSGHRYSFHFVTFQSATGPGIAAQLLQLSWSDHDRGLYLTEEKAGLTAPVSSPGRFDVQNSGWSMGGDGVDYALSFDTAEYSAALSATSRKPAVLHQGTGLVRLGPAGYTYYYSRTRLDLSGTLTFDGQPREVTGTAWMDHQWGEVSGQRVGWDWMSLQFDDGSELMAALVWDPVGHQPFAGYGTHIAPDGSIRHLDGEDLRLTPTGTWTSPASGVVYPMGWEFSVDSLGLDLALTPVQRDAEFFGSRFVPAAYWEGAVSVEGTSGGRPISGNGFVELVGYDPRQIESTLPPPG